MFSDRTIRMALNVGQLKIEPYDERMLQPASYEMRLSPVYLIQRETDDPVDTTNPDPNIWQKCVSTDIVTINPGELVLGSSEERFTFGDKTAGCVNGKSTLGRLGLQVHATAGFVDPGFEGNITLELSNVSRRPLILRVGQPVAQMVFFRLISSPHRIYGERNNHYQGQSGPTAPRTSRRCGCPEACAVPGPQCMPPRS